jgi:adenylate cyclase
MQKFLSELQRRKVLRVASGYVVAGWVILQVALSLQAALKLPDWFSTIIVSLLIIGFPIAVAASWFFEFTPEGIKRTVPSGEVARFKPQTTDFALAAALVLVLAAVVVQLTTPPAAVTVAAAPQSESPVSGASIAVLPFADLSPDKDQEYFSQGIAEEILNVLANVSGLEVASRTSSFQFKGQEKIGVPLIAHQLRVRHILEGSVRKAGDTIRITAQLIDAKTDKHLWSQTFDRTMTTENIFAIQDEITKAIVGQLSSRIGARPIAAPAARSADTENADAYALYLEGQTRFVARGQENIIRSMSALERAIEIDPGFARAWAVLAADYSIAPGWLSGADLVRDFPKLAVEAAKKAIELDPSLSLPYAVLAAKAANVTDYEAAFSYFDQAVARNPKDETIYMWRAEVWRDLGFFDRALADWDRCLSLNPDYNNCREHKSALQVFIGDVAGALATRKENVRRGFAGTTSALWGAYLSRGDEIEFLYEINELARTLSSGDMHWAVEMIFQAQTNPSYDRKEGLRIFEARLDGMGAPPSPGSYNEIAVLFLFGAYDRMHPVGDSWWWLTTGFPEWAKSPERKRLMRERKLDVYWRKHGFPPRCKPVGKDDFECK